jgi:hypothetical protein
MNYNSRNVLKKKRITLVLINYKIQKLRISETLVFIFNDNVNYDQEQMNDANQIENDRDQHQIQ